MTTSQQKSCRLVGLLLVAWLSRGTLPAHAKGRPAKSPEAKVRVTERGEVVSYTPQKEITIRVTSGEDKGQHLKLEIGQGDWPHLGSVFFEAIFEPPEGYEKDFPVHSPMKPDKVKVGHKVWFALEGPAHKSLQLYQIAVHIPTKTPAEFNAVVRNAVKLRESRKQPEIARDYQCRLIESPRRSGTYPDDPTLLERFVRPDSIFADRLEVKAPPPGREGYGKGLKSSDVYENGVGSAERRRPKK